MDLKPVAYFKSPLPEKFGIPRQSGLADALKGEIRFTDEYSGEEAVRGLEGFDYLWIIWGFSLNRSAPASLTVRPPRLGGNTRLGVFATRSPFRPNPLGLSCVRIVSVRPGVITVQGADLADGTPVYDIKPYVSYADCHPDAKCGFADGPRWEKLTVEIPEGMADMLGPDGLEGLVQILGQDPRPQYHDDPDRIYGLAYSGFNVRFNVKGGRLTVLEIIPAPASAPRRRP